MSAWNIAACKLDERQVVAVMHSWDAAGRDKIFNNMNLKGRREVFDLYTPRAPLMAWHRLRRESRPKSMTWMAADRKACLSRKTQIVF